ncbi:DUF3137 domain-containing protein [Cohnella sp.]|uniref:DUF3137 domain-containing protein n=1 Tax=Cohnella sp. TaxID=1883426 RepID=UPI00370370B5
METDAVVIPPYEEFASEIAGEISSFSTNPEYERMRNRHLRKYVIYAGCLLATVAFLLYIVDFAVDEESFFEVMLFGLTASIAAGYVFYRAKKNLWKDYSAEYKQRIIPILLDKLKQGMNDAIDRGEDYQCDYEMEKYVGHRLLKRTKLFDHLKINGLEGEDHISGRLGEIRFHYSEISSYEEYTSNDEYANKRSMLNFQGFVFVADFPKSFEGTTIIESRGRTARNYKLKLRKLPGLEMMRTDDIAFNRFYKVRTNDETLARYLLPANMLERLLLLKKIFPRKKIAISLHDGLFALAIHRMDLFEIQGFRPISEKAVRRTYEELKTIMELLFTLGLNRQISGQVSQSKISRNR